MDVTNTFGSENIDLPPNIFTTLQPERLFDVVLAEQRTYDGQNVPFLMSLSSTIASEKYIALSTLSARLAYFSV